MRTFFLILFIGLAFISCDKKKEITQKENKNFTSQTYTDFQEKIIETSVDECAKKAGYRFNMKKWQNCLDEGLKKDSTISYLWQQKAMPYFKIKKYEVGMNYLDKAVYYNEERYLPYRGFIKCIFSREYEKAIKDFEICIEKWGDTYVMDHSFSFYLGLSHLQLNHFEKANQYFKKSVSDQQNEVGFVHFNDLFYLGISFFEMDDFEAAIENFDLALEKYPEFPEARLYKALSLYKSGKNLALADELYDSAKEFHKKGYGINEDNAIYETYPYTMTWGWN